MTAQSITGDNTGMALKNLSAISLAAQIMGRKGGAVGSPAQRAAHRRAANIARSARKLPLVQAPWTEEQVEALAAFQAGTTHPYRCDSCAESLLPEADGLNCATCGFRQTYARRKSITAGAKFLSESGD